MKASQLREKSQEELVELEAKLRNDLFKLNMRHYTGQLQRTSELSAHKRNIARVQTILAERKV